MRSLGLVRIYRFRPSDKWADCKAVAELAKEVGIANLCFDFSFDPEMRDQMRLYAPEIKRMIWRMTAGSIQSEIDNFYVQMVKIKKHGIVE